MGMITSIRAPLPVAEAPPAPVTDTHRPGTPVAGTTAAVADPVHLRAVQQAPSRPPASDPQLLAVRTTVETSAAEAAEAARAAYIRASIAAGISPLPLG